MHSARRCILRRPELKFSQLAPIRQITRLAGGPIIDFVYVRVRPQLLRSCWNIDFRS